MYVTNCNILWVNATYQMQVHLQKENKEQLDDYKFINSMVENKGK